MKVAGHREEVSPEAYARAVADLVAQRLAEALRHHDPEAELPPPSEVSEAIAALLPDAATGVSNELASLVGPFWSGARARAALGLRTRQALEARRKRGSVLAVRSAEGQAFYPVDQFHRRPDGRIAVKPALVPLLRTLRSFDSWAVAVLLHTPAAELHGLTPLAWAREGHSPQVLRDLGQQVAREWGTGTA